MRKLREFLDNNPHQTKKLNVATYEVALSFYCSYIPIH